MHPHRQTKPTYKLKISFEQRLVYYNIMHASGTINNYMNEIRISSSQQMIALCVAWILYMEQLIQCLMSKYWQMHEHIFLYKFK